MCPRIRCRNLAVLFAGIAMSLIAATNARGEKPADLRAQFLAGPMRNVEEIVFAARSILHEHWYANIGYWAADRCRPMYGKFGKLCKLNLRTGKLTLLIDDPQGGVRDPAVHYDGKRILFSYRKGGTENYLLYIINADGTGLRRITDGKFDDYEPCWLPDGGIAFVTTRAKRWVNCWSTQVGNIWRCDADGGQIRPLVGQYRARQHPLGLARRPHPLHALGIHRSLAGQLSPSLDDVSRRHRAKRFLRQSASRRGVHRCPADPRQPRRDHDQLARPRGDGTRRIRRPGQPATGARRARATWSTSASMAITAIRGRSAASAFMAAENERLVLMNDRGETATLFTAPKEFGPVWLHEPRPIVAHPVEFAIPPRVDLARPTGNYLLEDVYRGRNMSGIRPGEIKKLMVIESLPKPINFTGGMDPLSYGGTFTLERVLGTVPVEADGSAFFEAPALRSLLFVALDDQDLAVKRMQSFTTVQPGETAGCIGCHEHRTTAPPSVHRPLPLAAQRQGQRDRAVPDVPDVADFPRDVQPILDRNCLRCHDYDRRDGGVILSGDHGPMFSHSYYTLTVWRQLADGRNQPQSNYAPRTLGSGGSPLMKLLAGGHYDVKPTERERRVVQLWLDIGAPYPGTYAALGTGSIGGYMSNAEMLNNDRDWPETRAAQSVFIRRCESCHDPRDQPHRADALRRERREFLAAVAGRSAFGVLAAHHLQPLAAGEIARAPGPLGPQRRRLWAVRGERLLSRLPAREGQGVRSEEGVFLSTADPDYRLLLAMCEAGKRRLEEIKRFDMPGFKPREEYIREMKRYGLLPESFDINKEPLDVYQLDRRYWDPLSTGR